MELRTQAAAAGHHFLDEDAVVFRAEFEVVDDADLRNDEAEFRRDLAADRLDLVGELAARGLVDEAEQAMPTSTKYPPTKIIPVIEKIALHVIS